MLVPLVFPRADFLCRAASKSWFRGEFGSAVKWYNKFDKYTLGRAFRHDRFCLIAMIKETLSGITIDAPTSKDLDDGLWLERLPENRFRVTVFVTDITELVPIDSPTDRRAYEKGATDYKGAFAANRMLPAAIEARGSLLPQETRPALAVHLDFDSSLRLERYALQRVRFHSLGRYSYRQAAAVAHGAEAKVIAGGEEIARIFAPLAEIALHLSAERKRRGAFNLFLPEEGFEINEDMQIVKLDASQRNVGYLIIQEFAILANQLISQFALQAGIPFVFRNHRVIFKENAELADEGFRLMIISEARRYLREVAVSSASNYLGGLLKPLRSRMTFERARYEAKNSGHMGLAVEAYAHNTSPLRRYADLINLRQITAHLSGGALPYNRRRLDSIAAHLTELMHARRDRTQERLRNARNVRRENSFEQIAENPAQVNKFKQKLTKLPEGEFYKMTDIWLDKVAPGAAGEIDADSSKAFLEAINAKIKNDTLPLKVAARILTYGIGDAPRVWRDKSDERIISLKRAALTWMAANPPLAVSLWTMLPDIMPGTGWAAAPDFKFSAPVHLKDFTCEASIKTADESSGVLTVSAESPQKKHSKALAALNLWILLNGFMPGEFAPRKTSATVSGPAKAAPIDFTEVLRELSPALGAGNYKSALFEFAARVKIEPPSFRLISGCNSGKNAVFEVEADLAPIAPIESALCEKGIGATKKKAENAAAKAVCRQLIERLGAAGDVPIPPDDETLDLKLCPAAVTVKSLLPAVDKDNYTVAVETYYRRLRQPIPELLVKELSDGAAKSWLVRLTALIGGDAAVFESENVSQKTAKRETYRRLYEKLSEAESGGSPSLAQSENVSRL